MQKKKNDTVTLWQYRPGNPIIWAILIITVFTIIVFMFWSESAFQMEQEYYSIRIESECRISVDVTRDQVLSMDELGIFSGGFEVNGSKVSIICKPDAVCTCN